MVETKSVELVVDEDLSFKADPERLQRLFENLFRNALDHGGPDVTVTVGALPNRSGFYVSDSGPGIPEDERESVFNLGYTTRENGTGFGLAIVAETVTAHGWDIQVTENTAGGARFEILGVEPMMVSTDVDPLLC
jgi:signal transduction histidine kinase